MIDRTKWLGWGVRSREITSLKSRILSLEKELRQYERDLAPLYVVDMFGRYGFKSGFAYAGSYLECVSWVNAQSGLYTDDSVAGMTMVRQSNTLAEAHYAGEIRHIEPDTATLYSEAVWLLQERPESKDGS
jgi:hypothetical protein